MGGILKHMEISFSYFAPLHSGISLAEAEGDTYYYINHPVNADISLNLADLNDWCVEVGVLDALDAWTENLIPDEFYSGSAEGYTTVGIDEYADRVESHLRGKGLDVQVTGTAMSDSNAFDGESILSVYPNQQFSPSDSLQRAVDEFVLPVTEALASILDWDSTDYVWK